MTPSTETLDRIVDDSKDSFYIDDAYYQMLRDDLVEWRGAGETLTPSERSAYESIVLQENWLLDQRSFEAWYGLFSSKALYWMPTVANMPDPVAGDPQTRVSVAFDDRRRMADRVVWMRTGVASSQLPVSRTQHMSGSFVRIATTRQNEVKIRSQFILHEVRADRPVQTLSGWMGHVFVREDEEIRIDRKLVCLLDADRARNNPTFLV